MEFGRKPQSERTGAMREASGTDSRGFAAVRFQQSTEARAVTGQNALACLTLLEYDANDNLLKLTDPDGNITSYVYDSLDRRTEMRDPRNKLTTYAYDPASRLTGKTDRLGRRIAYSYDNADRLIEETWYAAAGSVTERNTFTYDEVGNQTLAKNSHGAYTLHYDALDRVDVVTNPWLKTLTFTYDLAGNRTKMQDSFGGVETSVYDPANRLTSKQYHDGTQHLRADFVWTSRNQLDTLTRYSDLAGTTQVGLSSYAYDDALVPKLSSFSFPNSVWERQSSKLRFVLPMRRWQLAKLSLAHRRSQTEFGNADKDTIRLPHPRLEAHRAALARHQVAVDLPAQDRREGRIGLDRERGRAVGLGTAGDVIESARQAVGDRHVADRLRADVLVLDDERHDVARLGGFRVGVLGQAQRLHRPAAAGRLQRGHRLFDARRHHHAVN